MVSLAYPLLPAAFVLIGIWMTIYGFTIQPFVSAMAVLTIVTGAVIYHVRLRSNARHPGAPALGRV